MENWIYTKLVETYPGKCDVVTKPLGFPVDRLARKAMGAPDEVFAGLDKAKPLSRAQSLKNGGC